jgi:hypothetical protein
MKRILLSIISLIVITGIVLIGCTPITITNTVTKTKTQEQTKTETETYAQIFTINETIIQTQTTHLAPTTITITQTAPVIPSTNTITITVTETAPPQTIVIPVTQDLEWLEDIDSNEELSLFDIDGKAIAYIAYDRQSTIYMWNGTPVAYLYGGSKYGENRIYGYNGQHIGWFLNGIVYDTQGKRTGFTESTHPYYTSFEPFKSFKQLGFKGFRGFSKPRPLFSLAFSDIPLEDLLLSGE